MSRREVAGGDQTTVEGQKAARKALMPERQGCSIAILTRSNIAALIVTFNPEGDFLDRLRAIADQVHYVIIVDNNSYDDIRQRLDEEISKKTEIIRNDSNLGVATALNQGVQAAMARGYAWVLMLDQDTQVLGDMIGGLTSLHDECPFRNEVGIIAANSESEISRIRYLRGGKGNKRYVEHPTAMTSGSLLAVGAYQKVGRFRDDFFIESVDTEYCLRLRKHGYRVIVSCDPLMIHAAGRMEEHSFLGRKVLVGNHAPWRYYFMVRNFLMTVRKYFFAETKWSLWSFRCLIVMILKVCLYEDNRGKKLEFMALGLFDACRGKTAHPAKLIS